MSAAYLVWRRHHTLGVVRRVPIAGATDVLRTTLVQTIEKEWVAAMRAATHSFLESTYSIRW
jgi:hypothetical protein